MVKLRRHSWLILSGAVLAIAVAGGAWYFRDTAGPSGAAELSRYLPTKDATLLYIDMQAIRKSGILNMIAGKKAAEEPEYQSFVQATGFNYEHDLDEVAAAIRSSGSYFVLRGRLDWKKLEAYAQNRGGVCRSGYCVVDGSQPHRLISFRKLRYNLMALAVSADELAAYQVTASTAPLNPLTPEEPMWMLVPAAVLTHTEALPESTRPLALVLGNAERLVFSVGARGDHLQIAMDVTCANPEAASTLLVQLESTTNSLRKWSERSRIPNGPEELSTVLTGGEFRRENRRVYGAWPISRAFLDSL